MSGRPALSGSESAVVSVMLQGINGVASNHHGQHTGHAGARMHEDVTWTLRIPAAVINEGGLHHSALPNLTAHFAFQYTPLPAI